MEEESDIFTSDKVIFKKRVKGSERTVLLLPEWEHLIQNREQRPWVRKPPSCLRDNRIEREYEKVGNNKR